MKTVQAAEETTVTAISAFEVVYSETVASEAQEEKTTPATPPTFQTEICITKFE